MTEQTEEKTRSYNHKAYQCGVGVFVGFVKHEDFKREAENLLKILEDNKYCRQINDVSRMKILSSETLMYLMTSWFPRAAKLGLKWFAFIEAEDKYGDTSEKQANKDAAKKFGITIEYFPDIIKAGAWLLTKSYEK